MIRKREIIPMSHEGFDPDGNSLGFFNEYEFHDLCIQIKEEKKSGYYMLFKNKKIYIDENGSVDIWRDGFFDTTEKQLIKLLF